MRWIRFIIIILSSRFRRKLRISDESRIHFSVWITDIDVSIMNHAAMMTVMECGRIDLMVRTGFFRLAQKSKWYFPSSSIHVQYFSPLKLFQQATLLTRVLHTDEKWIYLEQKIIRNEKTVAACIVRSTVKKKREQVNVIAVVKDLNIGDPPVEASNIIDCFERSDKLMRLHFE